MKRSHIIASLLILAGSKVQAATTYFETTADYTLESIYDPPLTYVHEFYDTLLNRPDTKYQADLRARSIYTGNGTSPYSVAMSTATRFVDRAGERDALQLKYDTNTMEGNVINAIHSRNGILLGQLEIENVVSESSSATLLATNYQNLFAGGPSTSFDVTLTMDFNADTALDWRPIANYFRDLNEQAFGPVSETENIFPFAPVAIVEDWTFNTNDGQVGVSSGESSGSYSRSFYFNSRAEADSFGRKIKADEDTLLTLAGRSIGAFSGFTLNSSSTNAVPEPSSTLLSFIAAFMLVVRRKR